MRAFASRLTVRLGLAALFLTSPVVLADEPETAEDVVQVIGSKAEGEDPRIEQIRQDLADIPGGTNFADLSEETRLSNFSDTFNFVPGLVVQEFSGSGDLPRLNIRGSGLQGNPVARGVLLLQDGLPINDADGSYIIGLIDPKDAAYVTAHRGANSRALGPATLGGDINFISPAGRDATVTARASAGSFGRWSVLGSLGGAGENWDGRVSYSRDRYDGYRHHSELKRQAAHAGFGLKLGGVENRTRASWTRLEFELPFALNKQRFEDDPQSVIGDYDVLGPVIGGVQSGPLALLTGLLDGSIQVPRPRQLQSPFEVLIEYMLNVYRRDPHRAVEHFRLQNVTEFETGRFSHHAALYGQFTDDAFVDPLSHALSDIWTGGAQWQTRMSFGAFDLALGLDAARSHFDRRYFASNQQNGQKAGQYADLDMVAAHILGDMQMGWRFAEGWQALLSLQTQWASREIENRQNGDSLDQSHFLAIPKIGLIWGTDRAWQVFSNVSASREVPSFWELAANKTNPIMPAQNQVALTDLDVQKAITVEVGASGEWLEGHRAQITLYRSWLDDELMSTAGGTGLIDDTVNYDGRTIHQGIEIGAGGRVGLSGRTGLRYRLAYVFNDFYFADGEFDTNRMAGVPKSLLNAQILFEAFGFSIGPSVQWVATKNPTDHRNLLFQDPYTLVGVSAEYRSEQGWHAYVRADNLTDKTYASAYVVRAAARRIMPTFLPGNGRSIDAGVALSF